MPSQIPASFASAAASNAPGDGSVNGRNLSGGTEWPRARPNGATQTFRRPSQANTSASSRESSHHTHPSTSNVYVPPHMNSTLQSAFPRTSIGLDNRYSKDQLLDLWRAQLQSRSSNENLPDVLTEGWTPGMSNTLSNGGWASARESKDGSGGPDICWDQNGEVEPLGLINMGDDEKELFASSVNSPLKPPPQNPNKEIGPQTPGINGRKSSVSQGQSGGMQAGRPSIRRRDTSDSLPSSNPLASPTSFNSRSQKDESQVSSPPPSLMRRRTDFKDGPMSFGERSKLETGLESSSPFGSFKRGAGPLSAGINGPSSPWANSTSAGPQSAGFGAFGNFSIEGPAGQPNTPGEKKAAFGNIRSESRFRGLMSKDSSEDMSKPKEKPNLASLLDRLAESDSSDRQNPRWGQNPSTRLASKGSNVFDDMEQTRVGSAALGGDDASPPAAIEQSLHTRLGQQKAQNEIGFSSFGGSSDMAPFRDSVQHRRDIGSHETPQGHHLYPGHSNNEPMSPTSTNPYQSPEADKANDGNGSDDDNQSNPYGQRGGPLSKSFVSYDGTDRSQTSSAGGAASRGLQGLGGLGAIGSIGGNGGWSAAPGAIGTPTARTMSGPLSSIQDSLFGSMGDASSAPTGMFAAPVSAAYGAIGRGGSSSKMGSLFPNPMQEQMRGDHGFGDMPLGQARSALTPNYAVGPARETDSPARQNRGVLDDLFGNIDARNKAPGGPSPFPVANDAASAQSFSQPPSQNVVAAPPSGVVPPGPPMSNPSVSAAEASSNQMPAAQQRQMVMPDRMRWIYRDPQGNTQGPWSGLEMHDWYKAGFFSPELQVKKREDNDYEPLAQLIRRIGNSREPFLVPQIGIPHGEAAPASASAGGSTMGSMVSGAGSGIPTGTAQPPFASNFPSFGTTLTAEQQNALERRKQEEQFLMARQKEHLAQHQILIKQVQMGGMPPHGVHPQSLHHHSSAHSLHSQPSYGSITSPSGGYQASPGPQLPLQQPGGVIPAFFDGRAGQPPQPLGGFGGDMMGLRDSGITASMERLNLVAAAQSQYGGHPHPPQHEGLSSHQHQVANMLQDRARLQREQEQFERSGQHQPDDREAMERFEQYHQLRSQQEKEQLSAHPNTAMNKTLAQARTDKKMSSASAAEDPSHDSHDPSTKARPRDFDIPAPEDSTMLQQGTGPPAPSISPLPAPAARRNRQHVAEALNAESRSAHSRTPSVETPSATLAPWAKETNEGSKGPSLKEIQEAESRKTAQQEEYAAAQRRAVADQERIVFAQQAQQLQPVAGLPSSANWAASASPTAVANATSAWAKKTPVATPAPGAKKTLAQIQKEEEARKNRAAAAAAAATASSASTGTGPGMTPGGKRYAELASKGPATSGPGVVGGAWTTVGASGKVKGAVGPSGVAAPQRTVSGSTVVAGAKQKPSQPSRSNTGALAAAQSAHDEFQKWAKSALGKGLNNSINVDDFVRNLLQLPAESEILSEAVYANSQTLDGHRFAEEFIRRRKLADKGIAPDTSAAAVSFASGGGNGESGSGGGWNEVAKKGGIGAAASANGGAGGNAGSGGGEAAAFKVVAAKKKGKR